MIGCDHTYAKTCRGGCPNTRKHMMGTCFVRIHNRTREDLPRGVDTYHVASHMSRYVLLWTTCVYPVRLFSTHWCKTGIYGCGFRRTIGATRVYVLLWDPFCGRAPTTHNFPTSGICSWSLASHHTMFLQSENLSKEQVPVKNSFFANLG